MTDKTPEDISAALGVPFPTESHRTRPMGNGQATYVEGHTVIHRLIDATDNHWNFTVDKIERTEIDAQKTMVLAYVTLEIPGLGTRSHIGVQAVNVRGGEDLVKGAVTDALKKAATLFGVGLELYGPDYEAGEVRDTRQTQPNGAGRPQPATPARRAGTSVNTVPVDPDDYDDPPADPGIVSWKAFWDEANTYGYKFKTPLEAAMKESLGTDPAYALERFQAWVKDTAQQKVLV